jgi:hypothetical protein
MTARPSPAPAAPLAPPVAGEAALRPGWVTVAGKELADHLRSVRFYVLLAVLGSAALIPLYFAAERIRALAADASGAPAV